MRTFTNYTKDLLFFRKPRNDLIIWYFDGIEEYIKEEHIEGFKITYMKEKYGGLRIEWQGGDKILHDVCFALENDSEKICYICGAKGKIRYDMGWFICLCWRHYIYRKTIWIYRRVKRRLGF